VQSDGLGASFAAVVRRNWSVLLNGGRLRHFNYPVLELFTDLMRLFENKPNTRVMSSGFLDLNHAIERCTLDDN
jgi:NADH/NAD ratio-sensing transcriptional regulator Rex